jgi:hypothetical protein
MLIAVLVCTAGLHTRAEARASVDDPRRAAHRVARATGHLITLLVTSNADMSLARLTNDVRMPADEREADPVARGRGADASTRIATINDRLDNSAPMETEREWKRFPSKNFESSSRSIQLVGIHHSRRRYTS